MSMSWQFACFKWNFKWKVWQQSSEFQQHHHQESISEDWPTDITILWLLAAHQVLTVAVRFILIYPIPGVYFCIMYKSAAVRNSTRTYSISSRRVCGEHCRPHGSAHAHTTHNSSILSVKLMASLTSTSIYTQLPQNPYRTAYIMNECMCKWCSIHIVYCVGERETDLSYGCPLWIWMFFRE